MIAVSKVCRRSFGSLGAPVVVGARRPRNRTATIKRTESRLRPDSEGQHGRSTITAAPCRAPVDKGIVPGEVIDHRTVHEDVQRNAVLDLASPRIRARLLAPLLVAAAGQIKNQKRSYFIWLPASAAPAQRCPGSRGWRPTRERQP
jgi:hypothetical protein